jgi:hypothetical protein
MSMSLFLYLCVCFILCLPHKFLSFLLSLAHLSSSLFVHVNAFFARKCVCAYQFLTLNESTLEMIEVILAIIHRALAFVG